LFTIISMLVLLAIGGLLVSRGWRRWSAVRAIQTAGAPVLATVVDNQFVGGGQTMRFSPVLSFVTADGREITAAAKAVGYRSFLPGTTMPIRYDPANPSEVIIDGESRSPMVWVVAGGIIVALSLYGLVQLMAAALS
jgi:hypothetical protein